MKTFVLVLAAVVTVSSGIRCFNSVSMVLPGLGSTEMNCAQAKSCWTAYAIIGSMKFGPFFGCDEENKCKVDGDNSFTIERHGYPIEGVCCGTELCNVEG